MGKSKVVAVSLGSVLGLFFAFVVGVVVAALLNDGGYGVDGYHDEDEGVRDYAGPDVGVG